jgi:uncharacterized protein (TIGR03083 family)
MAPLVVTCVDRFRGVEPGPQAVAAAFSSQRRRMSALFHTFDDRQWQTTSRCSEWTVQQVVRHLVDAATIDGELLRGEGPRNEGGRIDPRTDPGKWLVASDGQSPAETVAAFDAASAAEQAALELRSRNGSDELLPGPYGPLHWTSLAAHLFWDAWIHERDIVAPLGLPHDATPEEDRLAALYALAVSATAPTFVGATVTTTIALIGAQRDVYDVAASADGTRVEVVDGTCDAQVRAELAPLVDSLAGRGPGVDAVAEGPADVIEQLGMLRAFFLPEP